MTNRFSIMLTKQRSYEATACFTDKATGDVLDLRGLALRLSREGAGIIACKVWGIIHDEDEGQYYLEDKCDNQAWINPERFEIDVNVEEVKA